MNPLYTVGLLTKVIPLKLFLDVIPRYYSCDARTAKETFSKLRETKWPGFCLFCARLAFYYFTIYLGLGSYKQTLMATATSIMAV